MSTQHTPGPWRMGMRTGQRYVYGPKGQEIAGPSTFTSGHDETLANTRLIAAAPDLLADLEGLIGSVSHLLPYNHPALVNARAAIERATGSGFTDHRSPDELAASYPRMSVWTEGEGAK